MTEMLATLAIYGIITITGIYGFQYLINKHRANSILGEAQMHAALLAGNALNNGLPESTGLNNMSYQFTYRKESDVAYSLNLSGIDKSVCKILWGTRDLGWAETVLLNNGADCTEQNTLSIYINTGMTTKMTDEKRITTCESDNDCGECGTCAVEQKVCVYSDSLCSSSDKSYCNKGRCQECPVGQVKSSGDNKCHHCDEIGTILTNPIERCLACNNRFVDMTGVSYRCDYPDPVKIGSATFSQAELRKSMCQRCPNRVVVQAGLASDIHYCAKKCTQQNEFMDAKGECVTCNSPSFHIGWMNNPPEEQLALRDKCIACPNMTGIFSAGNRDCYNWVNDTDTATIMVYTADCQNHWKGKRYVSSENKCTLCPSDISGLTLEQQAQCTP